MIKPKLSIIIPVYNTEKYLLRCLNSIKNQTLDDIELIIIDDHSDDSSWEIINNFKADTPELKIIIHHNTVNKGAAHTRNFGISIATGEFIGFVDSDDYVDEGYFENLYNQRKDYDVIRGIRLVDGRHCKNPYGCIVPSIIRKDLLNIKKGLRFPNRKKGEDSTFKRWLYNETDKIYEVEDNGIYYHYERRIGSLSGYKL